MQAFMNDLKGYQNKFKNTFELTFNLINKCSIKVYGLPNNQLLICIKGEPESLIQHSRHILTSNGLTNFSDLYKNHLLSLCDKLGKEKHRMIGQ